MSDIGVPNESALSYKNSHNAEQMCAKWRTRPWRLILAKEKMLLYRNDIPNQKEI